MSQLTRTPLSRSKVNLQGAGHIVAVSRRACLILPCNERFPCIYCRDVDLFLGSVISAMIHNDDDDDDDDYSCPRI